MWMPALPFVPGVLRVQFNTGVGASIEAGSRFYVSYSGGPPNSTDLNTMASDVADYWETSIGPYVASSEALHGVIITDMASISGAVGTWTGTKAGTNAGGPSLAASISMVVNHQTGQHYRGGHPRTYLRVGVADSADEYQTNVWAPAFLADVLTAWQAWVAAILAISTLSITLENIVSVSYYDGYNTATPPWRGPGFKYPPMVRAVPEVVTIVNSSCATKFGSQRRRLNV
jgi:hypothetical protein